MTEFMGMNVEQARGAAHQMDGGASAVQGLVDQITAMLGSVTWVGEDAKAFQADWNGSFRPQLGGAVQALRENARELSRRADAQEQISGAS